MDKRKAIKYITARIEKNIKREIIESINEKDIKEIIEEVKKGLAPGAS